MAFCPERLAEGQAIQELTSIPVVVGAVDERSARACATLWRHALGVESVIVEDPRTAEMVKLADNLWVDLNVALANELAKVCDGLGMDALQVIEAANTMPKGGHPVNILRPSMGVGGYCLTKDPWFVNHLGESLGLDLAIPRTSRTVNDTMPAYTYGLLTQLLADQGKAIETSRIAVLGIAFKNNTGDCRLTPTKYVVALLEESGCELSVHDPWVGAEDAAHGDEYPPDRRHRDGGRGCRRLGGARGPSAVPPDPAVPARGAGVSQRACSSTDGTASTRRQCAPPALSTRASADNRPIGERKPKK